MTGEHSHVIDIYGAGVGTHIKHDTAQAALESVRVKMQRIGLPVRRQYDHVGIVRVGLTRVTDTCEQGPSVCALGVKRNGVGRAGDQANLAAQVHIP